MTFAIVTHTVGRNDGQGRVNYEIVRAAVARGHRVILVATHVDERLERSDAVTWIHIPVRRFPTELLRNQVFAWRSARWLRRNREMLDLVLANGAITWPAADVNVAHFVHGAWLQSPVHTMRTRSGPYAWYQGVYTAVNALWERHAFRQARAVVAVSGRVQEELEAIGISPHKIRVIPNGVDLDEFTPGPPERSRFGLPEDVTLGALVGDLKTPRKNVDSVLRSMTRVPDFHLALAGRQEGSPYPAVARELGVHDRVHFIGFCADVPALFRSVDVCLCPSRYEPFSLVLLEALATGCPVITSRNVGAAALLPTEAGWVIDDPTDICALTGTIYEVMRAKPLHRMKQAARDAAEQHSFDRMAAAYVDLLEETSCPAPAPVRRK